MQPDTKIILEGLFLGGSFAIPKPGSSAPLLLASPHLCQLSNSLPSGKGAKGIVHPEQTWQKTSVAPPPVKAAVKYLQPNPRNTHGCK